MALCVSELKPNSRKMKNINKEILKRSKEIKIKARNKKEIKRKNRYARKAENSEKITKSNVLSYQRTTGSLNRTL